MKIKTKRGARRTRNQRVITKRFVTTDYTGCPYITAGKLYEVFYAYYNKSICEIETDRYFMATIILPDNRRTCAHLGGRKWQWLTI